MPLQVRHQFQYNLYASDIDRATNNPVFSYQQTLPNLAGKKITLSFKPATQADADLIASYLPAPHADGTPILPSEMPASLPGYLIHLTAEMRVDGQIVATGGTFTMGEELIASEGVLDPATNTWGYGEDFRPTAGEYIATHVDLQGVSQGQLQTLKDKLVATQAKITAAQYAGLTKEDLSGDILYSAVLSYFAANQAASQISQRAAGIVEYRKPSFGNFMASASTTYWFGIPRNVTFPGLVMDIKRYANIVVAKDNSSTLGYMKQTGMRLSAYEHLIPEKLFTDPLDPNRPQGVSAVKALALASSQGQKIYTLNSANQANHATLLAQVTIEQESRAEIQNALAAGKEVTVHQSSITQSGWTGSGYIITDQTTGSGAYKISGGANGGYLKLIGLATGLVVGTAAIVAGAPVALFVGVIGFVISQLVNYISSSNGDRFNYSAARYLGTIAGLVLSVILGGYVIISLTPLFVIGFVLLMLTVMRLLIIELYTALADAQRFLYKRARFA